MNQKPLLESTDAPRGKLPYSLKQVDDEEQAVAAAKRAASRTAVKRLSDFQSGVGKRKRFYVVPDWAGAVTPDFVERAVLGVVDYWLGLDDTGEIRAKGDFLTKSDGFYWYVVTAGQLAKQIFGSEKQARRAVTRLDREGLIRKGVHCRGDRNVALRLRLNWPMIEEAIAEAWGRGDDDGEDE
jgi:hypothetical protein